MKLLNTKNNHFFSVKFLNKVCKKLNENTTVVNFFPYKITTTKFGLRHVILRSKYKENSKNSQCKLLLFENSKGNVKTLVRKGFMLSFLQDINLLKEIIKKYE